MLLWEEEVYIVQGILNLISEKVLFLLILIFFILTPLGDARKSPLLYDYFNSLNINILYSLIYYYY